MIIETKFDVGDEVYTLCHYSEIQPKPRKIYNVHCKSSTITRFNFYGYEKNKGYLKYILDGDVFDSLEEHLFKTKQEAQIECDRLNKESESV